MSLSFSPSHHALRNDDIELEGMMLNLPPVRGVLTPNAPLANQTWFRVGGPAEVLFKPADEEDLAFFLTHCPQNIPITILGLASNMLIRDGGVPGVVIKLGPSFATIQNDGAGLIVGAGAIDLNVARAAQQHGLSGLEFLCGIPGTIGGGLRMNAGAHGGEMKDVVESVTALDRAGRRHILSHADMHFSYRTSAPPEGLIFISAFLHGHEGDPSTIQHHMQDIQKQRAENQPIHEKTGGSTFANPSNDVQGRKAWQLIDEAGCRGLKIGQAKVSEKHCNFLINMGEATASDIENLGEEVRRRVFLKTGIELRWEIKRIGIPSRDKT